MTTATKAIKLKCLECSGDQAMEVTICQITDCALWERRMGTGKAAGARFEGLKTHHKKTYEEALMLADDPEKFKTGVGLMKVRVQTASQMAAFAKRASLNTGRILKHGGGKGMALPDEKESVK